MEKHLTHAIQRGCRQPYRGRAQSLRKDLRSHEFPSSLCVVSTDKLASIGHHGREVALVTLGARSLMRELLARCLDRKAKGTRWFDRCEVWTNQHLQAEIPSFRRPHSRFVTSSRHGFGFCERHPAIINFNLRRSQPNQVPLFLDAGCELDCSTASSHRLRSYLQFGRKHSFSTTKTGARAPCQMVQERPPDGYRSRNVGADSKHVRSRCPCCFAD